MWVYYSHKYIKTINFKITLNIIYLSLQYTNSLIAYSFKLNIFVFFLIESKVLKNNVIDKYLHNL